MCMWCVYVHMRMHHLTWVWTSLHLRQDSCVTPAITLCGSLLSFRVAAPLEMKQQEITWVVFTDFQGTQKERIWL